MAAPVPAAVVAGLNIPESQVLRYDVNHAPLYYRHKILFHQIEGSRWIVADADHEVEEDNFAGVQIIPVRRGAPFPAHVPAVSIYAFDVPTAQELSELRSEARQLALALGADLAKLTVHDDAKWLVADTDSKKFGEEVPNYDLGNPAHTIQLGDFALHTMKPGDDDEEVVKLELVGIDDVEDWRKQKAPGVVDKTGRETRLLGNLVNARGVRTCTFSKSVEMIKPPDKAPEAWRLRGPQVFVEFCDVVLQSGGDLDSYFLTWSSTSGVSEASAAYHEAKMLIEFLKAGMTVDQLDGSNCLSMEKIVRRFVEIQGAVRRNPKHPDFTGLSHGTTGQLDESGGVKTAAYHEWLAQQQKLDSQYMKYARENRDEAAAEKRRQVAGGGGGAQATDNGKKKKKKKWQKGNAGATASADA